MAALFLTGFPGFLGSGLLLLLLACDPGLTAVCLVRDKFAGPAEGRRMAIAVAHPSLAGRIMLVEGDIIRPGLGLETARWPVEVTDIHHLAGSGIAVPRFADYAATLVRFVRARLISASPRWPENRRLTPDTGHH